MSAFVEHRHSLSPVISYYRGFNLLEKSGVNEYNFLPNSAQRGSSIDYVQFGIAYSYRVLPKWSFSTGLLYSNPGLITDEETTLLLRKIHYSSIDKYSESKVEIRRNYIEIPTMIRHDFFSNRFCSSFIEIGVHHQFYQSSYSPTPENTAFRLMEVQDKYHASAQINFGSNIFISEHFQLFSQLNTTYQFVTLQQSGYDDRHTGLGFTAGGRYLW